MPPDCYSCSVLALPDPPVRDRIIRTEHWSAAHAFNATLPGWLVLVPTTHQTTIADLSPAAAAELGGLVHRLSKALTDVTGCTKTYVMQFSEAEGYAHLHFHLVPRMPDQPEDARGPRVFRYLADDESDYLPTGELEAISARIAEALPHH